MNGRDDVRRSFRALDVAELEESRLIVPTGFGAVPGELRRLSQVDQLIDVKRQGPRVWARRRRRRSCGQRKGQSHVEAADATKHADWRVP